MVTPAWIKGLGLIGLIGVTTGCMVAANQPSASSANASGATPVSGPPAESSNWKQTTVVRGLANPWAVAWLPDGRMLITEKRGGLKLVSADFQTVEDVLGSPTVFAGGQGGLMDVSLHPNFSQNRIVYLTYSTGSNGSNRTVLGKAQLVGNRLDGLQEIFRVSQSKDGGGHFGSRILWLPDGTMLLAIGDGGNPPTALNGENIRNQAQKLSSHLGKILRLDENGKAASGNPFAGESGATPELYSIGHRNIQGLARDSQTGKIWATEHGAQGGDELNLIQPGQNFGWPLFTHSKEYWGPEISNLRTASGKLDPKVVWTPATGPSGLAVYRHSRFPEWQGSVFAGGLRSSDVRRVEVDEKGTILRQERLSIGARVRDVRQGPDGFIYVLTDEGNGRLIRIERS
jgi:glucose/arabinose dehydrogenase